MGKNKIDDVFEHLKDIVSTNDIKPRGIIHVGAHEGQEVPYYQAIGFKSILLIEPMPEYAEALRGKGYEVVEAAINENKASVELYVTDYDQATSILKPLEHSIGSMSTVKTVPLQSVLDERFNCLVVDAQGSELSVLKSGNLNQFDLIIFEGSDDPRYEGAANRHEIGEFLNGRGLVHYKTYQHGGHDIYDEVYIKPTRKLGIITRIKKKLGMKR